MFGYLCIDKNRSSPEVKPLKFISNRKQVLRETYVRSKTFVNPIVRGQDLCKPGYFFVNFVASGGIRIANADLDLDQGQLDKNGSGSETGDK